MSNVVLIGGSIFDIPNPTFAWAGRGGYCSDQRLSRDPIASDLGVVDAGEMADLETACHSKSR